jgi:4-hydroxybenzoate polyprenyltransferase
MLSGAVVAAAAHPGGAPALAWSPALAVRVAGGVLMAMLLNAASNALNQIYDLELDRINKPDRPLPSGEVMARDALRASLALYGVALSLAWVLGWETGLYATAAAVLTYLYSVPPVRTKRHPILANVTIALPRGTLLKMAGWSLARPSLLSTEAWTIGAIFGLFLLGATSSKDFADVEGDRAHGCATLPVRYGLQGAARIIAPFFVVPFLGFPLGAALGVLTGNRVLLSALGVALAVWGAYVASLLVREPYALALDANHVSWRHMYLMVVAAQVGVMAAYLL